MTVSDRIDPATRVEGRHGGNAHDRRSDRHPKDRARKVRAVIGVPLYNGVRRGYLHGALDSLLAQTYRHAGFVFLDDGSSDETLEVVASVTAGDPRVRVARNPHRLGLAENWRRVFALAREFFPNAVYFAWGSDHDRWDPRWLAMLVAELDAHPTAVMAYPRFVRIDEHGKDISRPWPFSRRTSTPLLLDWYKIAAGKLVYGLYRAEMLQRVGVYPPVYQPDVYLLIELSLYGELRMVRETLWSYREPPPVVDAGQPGQPRLRLWWKRVRRTAGIRSVGRQHRQLFPGRVPLYSRLPSWLQHAALLIWRLAVLGRGRPEVGRRMGCAYAARFLFARVQQLVWADKEHRTRERMKLQQRQARLHAVDRV